ncbi:MULTISPECIES: hypothetical protein [unclassified Pseudoalteromonas]|uniref:hypothetical protein n=1 Tax=unclassified Pseudoalteromonas TaxID=194690 RepID=UPI0030157E4E
MLIRTLAIAIMSMVFSVTSLAIPISPSVKDVSGYFSIDSQNAFHLFADSDNSNLVWYIPKVASLDSAGGRPVFSVSSEQILSGPFNGLNSISFAGQFNSLTRNNRLSALRLEALLKGFNLQPVEAIAANTRIILAGFLLDNEGRLQVNCTEETWSNPSGTIVIPVCKAKSQTGEWLAVDFLSEFESTLAQPGNIGQKLPFSGKALPGWEYAINTLLESGTSWDGLIQFAIEWQLPTYSRKLDAKYRIDWLQLSDVLRPKIKRTGWRLSLTEVNEFIAHAIAERAGVKITYFKDRTQSQSAFSLTQKLRVESSIKNRLQKYLFTFVSHPSMLSTAARIELLNAPRKVFLPSRDELENKWGSEVTDRFPAIAQQYDQSSPLCLHSVEGKVCHSPMPPILLPPKDIEPPTNHQGYYILKANYLWLINRTISDFTVYHTDIEQVSATTLLNIDCVEGAIDQPIIFVNELACM